MVNCRELTNRAIGRNNPEAQSIYTHLLHLLISIFFTYLPPIYIYKLLVIEVTIPSTNIVHELQVFQPPWMAASSWVYAGREWTPTPSHGFKDEFPNVFDAIDWM